MDFSLSEEQIMIRDSCRQFITQRYSLEAWTQVAASGGFKRENWQELADLGYLSIGQPEVHGGMGGVVELAVICEEFGRGLLLEPFIDSAVLAAKILALAGSAEQSASLIPAMISGQIIVTLAHAEPGVREVDGIGASFEECGEELVLSGTKSLVVAGTIADWLIVSASGVADRQTQPYQLMLVDPKLDGVTLVAAPMVDRRWCADVRFDAVRVPRANLLNAAPAPGAVAEAQRHAQLAACAQLVGAVDRAVEIAVDYTKGRTQFGAPLSNFQALRHRVADMAIDREMARATLLLLLASFQDPEARDPVITAALAKAQLGEIARRVCAQAIQLHGAIGMTSECGVGRYFAKANALSTLYGQTDAQYDRYTRLLAAQLKQEAGSHV